VHTLGNFSDAKLRQVYFKSLPAVPLQISLDPVERGCPTAVCYY